MTYPLRKFFLRVFRLPFSHIAAIEFTKMMTHNCLAVSQCLCFRCKLTHLSQSKKQCETIFLHRIVIFHEMSSACFRSQQRIHLLINFFHHLAITCPKPSYHLNQQQNLSFRQRKSRQSIHSTGCLSILVQHTVLLHGPDAGLVFMPHRRHASSFFYFVFHRQKLQLTTSPTLHRSNNDKTAGLTLQSRTAIRSKISVQVTPAIWAMKLHLLPELF